MTTGNQITALNARAPDADSRLENPRSIINFSKKNFYFLTAFGSSTVSHMKDSYIQDYNHQDVLTANDVRGITTGSDVTNRVRIPIRFENQVMRWSKIAPTARDEVGQLPGDLGNPDAQSKALIEDAYEMIDKRGLGNFSGVFTGSSVDAEVASPICYASNGDETIADNPGLISAAGSSVTTVTNAGGYNRSTRIATHIQDNTSAASRGAVTWTLLVQALERIATRLDTAGTNDGMLKDEAFYAFLPSRAYASLVVQTLPGAAALNEFTTNLSGEAMMISCDVMEFSTPFGRLVIFPIHNQLGDATNNTLGMICHGDSTETIFRRETEINMLYDDPADNRPSVYQSFTFRPPLTNTMVAVVGVANT